MNVKISAGNSKMGNIPSVSLPAGKTCRSDCGCCKKCYAKKLERLRPNVHNSYEHNYELLKAFPDIYWREVEGQVMMSRYFRFHVSGDIPNGEYLLRMIDVADRNKHCEMLCFTKKYDTINTYLARGGKIPGNLHIILSGWVGLKMSNPFNLPEAHVKYRDGTTTARSDAHKCGGNCTECAITTGGCWSLKNGEQVVFDEH